MAKDKSHTVDWNGLNLLVSEVNGSAPAAQAAAQANSTATDAAGLVTDFNALLAKLRTAGILAT